MYFLKSIIHNEVKNVILKSVFDCYDFEKEEISFKRIGQLTSSGYIYKVRIKLFKKECMVFTLDILVKKSKYAALEKDWLLYINSRLAKSKIEHTVPKLLGFLDRENIVITTYLNNNTSFQKKILMATFDIFSNKSINNLIKAASSAGSWLAQFQEIVDLNNRQFLYDEIEDVSERLNELPFFNLAEKAKIIEILKTFNLELGPLPVLLCHGDFAPRNVLFFNDDIKVIDWEMVNIRPKPFLFDVHYFLTSIEQHQGLLLLNSETINLVVNSFIHSFSNHSLNKHFIKKFWKPTRIIALIIILSRQFRTYKQKKIYLLILRKQKFMNTLVNEIRKECKINIT